MVQAQARSWHHLTAATVENRAPDAADLRHLVHLAGGNHAQARHVVHHVTLHLRGLPPEASTAYHLWIGSERIEQYHAVPDGVSFRLHDSSHLEALYGQPIRFVPDHGPALDTGQHFPDLSRHLTRTVGHRWQQVYRP